MGIDIFSVKEVDAARRSVAKKFQFKQRSYANWKIEAGYFFSIFANIYYEAQELRGYVEVKPYYADELFWKIMDMESNIAQPDSHRAVGAFVVNSMLINEESIKINLCNDLNISKLEEGFVELYAKLNRDMENFLRKYPDVNKFYYAPESDRHMNLSLIILCHLGEYDRALKMAQTAIKKDENGGIQACMPDGTEKSDYMFIRDYCLSKIAENNRDLVI